MFVHLLLFLIAVDIIHFLYSVTFFDMCVCKYM